MRRAGVIFIGICRLQIYNKSAIWGLPPPLISVNVRILNQNELNLVQSVANLPHRGCNFHETGGIWLQPKNARRNRQAQSEKRRAGQMCHRKGTTAKGGKPQPAQSIHAGHTLPAPGQALCPAAYCTMSPPEGCMVTFSVPSFESFTYLSCASGSCPSLAFLSL